MNRTDCDTFAEIVQAVLDGDRPRSALDTDHAATCDDCRAIADSAKSLEVGIAALARTIPPRDFVADVIPVVLAERRRERFMHRAAATAALAASVLAAVALWYPTRPNDRAVTHRDPAPEPNLVKPPAIEGSLREAGTAFVSLTKRTAIETLTPARNLLAGIELSDAIPEVDPPRPDTPPVASPIAPIANTARRAINLFIRDVGGLAPSPQRKS